MTLLQAIVSKIDRISKCISKQFLIWSLAGK